MITLRTIVENPEIKKFGNAVDDFGVLVDGQVVWDYKDQDGEMRLIHEPYKGCEDELVTVKELEYGFDMPVYSEDTLLPPKGVELVEFSGITCINLLTRMTK